MFSHSHTLVNIPESQSLEGLTDPQVEKALTLGCKGLWTSRDWMQTCSFVRVRRCIVQGEAPRVSFVSKRGLRHTPLKVKNTG